VKLEKVIILCCFIVIGIYVTIVASNYPSIPNTMSPGFFPIAASVLLVCLSSVELILTLLKKSKSSGSHESKENISKQRGGFSKIMLVTAMLIAMVLVMRYVLPIVGIFIFLAAYLILIGRINIKQCVPISLIGTMVLYVIIKILRIPL